MYFEDFKKYFLRLIAFKDIDKMQQQGKHGL